jgi:coproporphyrinogen III oxidase
MTTNPVPLSDVRTFLLGLQKRITDAVAAIDGQPFVADHWQKEPDEMLQGNGVTLILEGGAVFERAGCGFSHVRGPKLPPSATQHRPELAGAPFEAMGVSLVFHPRNPYVPYAGGNANRRGRRAGLLVRRRDGSDAVLRF